MKATKSAPAGRSWRLLCAWLVVLAAGCTSLSREAAVPADLQDRAVLPGMGPQVRTWGGAINPAFMETMRRSVEWERDAANEPDRGGAMSTANFLAISGGGSNGAFGAGLLCGWTEAGDRPTFKLVTGVSTGALIAPFAYLGPEYDRVLREVYTKTKTEDILQERGVIGGLFSDAMADTKPLWKTLSRHVDQALLDAIAAEYRKGRMLLIGTTNLDAERAVLWNIGEIAASGNPNSLEIVRRIMIASASIPGAFPPVFFDVEVDGKKYQEMHVDGGAMTQVFLYPPSLKLRQAAAAVGVTRERRAYVIRNARLDPNWADTERSTMSILMRAVDALLQTQGVGDLYRSYVNAQRDGVDFNLAYIPASFKVESKEPFDPEYMTQLFQVGFDLAKNGYRWDKTPPWFEGPPGEPRADTGVQGGPSDARH
ncbi:MAG: patatin-like phospholipase family protein [Phycisphaerales bacterium]